MKLSRNARKLVALTLSAALVLGGTAVNGSSASAAKKATLKLNKKTAKLTVGKKVTLKVKKKNVKSAKVTWKSSKKAVASVSKKGVVKAKKAGKAKISATIKYKAKGSKKTKKKTLKCTVTVTKKTVVASKAPAPSSAANASKAPDGTKAPGGEATATPTPAPSGEATATPTPAPSGEATAAPTPSGEATAAPTEAPKPVQSLKITVKDGDTILKDAVVTIKDAADKAVTATKGEDGVYTTDKLVPGTYKVSVASLVIDKTSYAGVDRDVTISGNSTEEVQSVDITLVGVTQQEQPKTYTWNGEISLNEGYAYSINPAPMSLSVSDGWGWKIQVTTAWVTNKFTKAKIECPSDETGTLSVANNTNVTIDNPEIGKIIDISSLNLTDHVDDAYDDLLIITGVSVNKITLYTADEKTSITWAGTVNRIIGGNGENGDKYEKTGDEKVSSSVPTISLGDGYDIRISANWSQYKYIKMTTDDAKGYNICNASDVDTNTSAKHELTSNTYIDLSEYALQDGDTLYVKLSTPGSKITSFTLSNIDSE